MRTPPHRSTIPAAPAAARALLAAASLLALAHGQAHAAVPATQAEAASGATVRAGRHPGFDRLVIDLPATSEPRARRQGNVLQVSIPGWRQLDLSGVGGRLGGQILGVQARSEPDAAVLVVLLREGADYRLSTLRDNRVVLDVSGAKPAPAAPADSAAAPAREPAAPAKAAPPPPRAAAAPAAPAPAQTPRAEPAAAPVAVAAVHRPAAVPVRARRAPAAVPAVAAPPLPDMRRELYRRDLMIASLLQRVERLERGSSLPDEPLDTVVGGGAPAAGAAEGVAAPGAGAAGVVQVAAREGGAPPPPSAGDALPASAPPVASAQVDGEPAPVVGAAPGGGNVLLPSERALERVLARDGTLLLRPGELEVEPGLAFSRSDDGAPVFVTNGGSSFFIGEDDTRRRELVGSLALRAGMPFDSQLELSVPYRYVDQSRVTRLGDGVASEDGATGHGFGDLTVGAAKTLTRQKGWLPDLVARAYWDTRTGETSDDGVPLGGGFDEIGVSISALRRQDPLAFFAAIAYETALERDSVDPGDEIGLTFGAALAVSPETSLRFSLDQRFVDDSEFRGRSIDGSDQTAAVLTLEAATIIARGVLLDAGVDIGLSDDAPDYTARVSVPIRFNLPIL